MELTQEESRILQDLSRKIKYHRPRRKRESDFEARREERLAQWRQVGDLINRYELWLEQN
jgi:hypothetical protein